MLQHRIRNQHNFSTGPSDGNLQSPQMQTGQRFRLACSKMSGESGIRTTSKNAGKTSVSKQGGAECGAAGVRKDSVDADLQKLIETWPRLSETVQAVILKLVHDSVSVSTTS
jgi:hypothetical protein